MLWSSGTVVAPLSTTFTHGCASTPAEEDPTQIKLNDLDVRLTRLERALQNQGQVQNGNQLESLRADIRAMHNDVDLLSNNLEASRKQQRDLYADLDQRLKNVESRGGGGAAAEAGAGGGTDDKSAYQAAANAPVKSASRSLNARVSVAVRATRT